MSPRAHVWPTLTCRAPPLGGPAAPRPGPGWASWSRRPSSRSFRPRSPSGPSTNRDEWPPCSSLGRKVRWTLRLAICPLFVRRMIGHAPALHTSRKPPLAVLRAQREALCRRLPALLRPGHALAIVAGDFNFVTTTRDRWNKTSGEYTGGSDTAEAAHWRRMLPQSALYLSPIHI